jgi:hypothetical protein
MEMNVQNTDQEIVLNLLNTVKECPEDYLATIIPGGNVRKVYISIRKVFNNSELYDIGCTYRIIVTGGYVISATLDYKLLEFFKLNENNYKSL